MDRHNNWEMFETLIKEFDLPRDTVEACLETAIAESMRKCLGVYDCDVDLKNRIAVGVYRIPQDMSLEQSRRFSRSAVDRDIVTVKFDFSRFPMQVVRKCEEIFPRLLLDMQVSTKFRQWHTKRRTAVRAVVIDRERNAVRLDLGGQVGLMLRAEWVLAEAKQRYEPGKPLYVYVTRVERGRSEVTVFVSRQTRNLAAILLKQRLPWYTFLCVYRKAGSTSVVLTDCPLHDRSLDPAKKEAETELGERIQIKTMGSTKPSQT